MRMLSVGGCYQECCRRALKETDLGGSMYGDDNIGGVPSHVWVWVWYSQRRHSRDGLCSCMVFLDLQGRTVCI
jgi:hypothetical protein